jgi:hypothetical protein
MFLVTTAQINALKVIGLVDAVVEQHFIAALRARTPTLLLIDVFCCEASSWGAEKPLSGLTANCRCWLNDPQITPDLVEHELPNLSVA